MAQRAPKPARAVTGWFTDSHSGPFAHSFGNVPVIKKNISDAHQRLRKRCGCTILLWKLFVWFPSLLWCAAAHLVFLPALSRYSARLISRAWMNIFACASEPLSIPERHINQIKQLNRVRMRVQETHNSRNIWKMAHPMLGSVTHGHSRSTAAAD